MKHHDKCLCATCQINRQRDTDYFRRTGRHIGKGVPAEPLPDKPKTPSLIPREEKP